MMRQAGAAAAFVLLALVLRAGVADGTLPGWYRWGLLVAIACLIFGIIPQWIVVATRIAPDGIRRNFAAHRQITWDDVADFEIARSWGIKRIHVQRDQSGLSKKRIRSGGKILQAGAHTENQIGFTDQGIGC